MRAKLRSVSLLVGASVALLVMGTARPEPRQDSGATSQASYEDSSDGLQQLVQSFLAASKRGDIKAIEAALRHSEIPDCDAWLHNMYESDKADSWMSLCDAHALESREKSMETHLAQLAQREGRVQARKVNDSPEGDVESAWLSVLRQPLDIYFVGWKPTDRPDAKPEPIGYFMYIDGDFRWDSNIRFASEIVVPKEPPPFLPVPQLLKRVDPVYPPGDKAQHTKGTVRVYYVIGGDGQVYNAHALSGNGLSNDPLLREASEEAVTQWRYEPAGGNAQRNSWVVRIDITFSDEGRVAYSFPP